MFRTIIKINKEFTAKSYFVA